MIYKSKKDIDIAKEIISCPGDTIAETIAYKGMSQQELATRMDRPLKTIIDIINGKTAITLDTALQLEEILGIGVQFWINREKTYRLELAAIEKAEHQLIKVESQNKISIRQNLPITQQNHHLGI